MPRSKSASNNPPAWASALGERLRKLRSGKAVSLAEVAAATGISASFLSLLEQGRTDVSLGRLMPLLDYYGIGLTDVFPQDPSPERGVVRRDERAPLFSPADGIDVYLAAPDQRQAFVPLIVEYRRGSVMRSWSEHDGDEYVFVLGGSLVVELADAREVTLAEGDSLCFSSRNGHRMYPAAGRSARALIITTGVPPSSS